MGPLLPAHHPSAGTNHPIAGVPWVLLRISQHLPSPGIAAKSLASWLPSGGVVHPNAAEVVLAILAEFMPEPLCLPPLPLPVAASIAVAPSSRVLEGHAANLTCRLSSDSPALPNFTWYRNGQQLAEGSAASLVFRQVASTDAGFYHCRATTDSSSRSSPPVSLDVLCTYGLLGDPQLLVMMMMMMMIISGFVAYVHASVPSSARTCSCARGLGRADVGARVGL